MVRRYFRCGPRPQYIVYGVFERAEDSGTLGTGHQKQRSGKFLRGLISEFCAERGVQERQV